MLENNQFKKGDIVWLDNDLSILLGNNVQTINRPYVIVSNNMNNKHCPTINVASLSKQVSKKNYPMHVFLSKDKYNLDYDSIILTEQLLTINKNKIHSKVASLDKKDLRVLNEALYLQIINNEGKKGGTKKHESKNNELYTKPGTACSFCCQAML